MRGYLLLVGHQAMISILKSGKDSRKGPIHRRAAWANVPLATGASTQPALAGYLSDPARAVAAPAGLFVLTMAGTAPFLRGR